MINEACHHQVSNNLLEGKRNMEGIQAIGFLSKAHIPLTHMAHTKAGISRFPAWRENHVQ